MKQKKKNLFLGLFLLTVLPISMAQAAVISSAAVGGLATFQDTNTGRQWLRLDNFFNAAATTGTSGNAMIAAAQGAGFTFALQGDVEQLLGSLPLGANGSDWGSYAAVIGYGIPRELIWGMFDDANGNLYGWAYAFSTASGWAYNTNVTDANVVQNAGSFGNVDMGIWAYRTGQVTSVPEPASLALLGLGLAGLGIARRRAKA